MTNKYSRRWHPHFIEFCLSIHAKSSSVYNELRKSTQNPDGILYLPHERTLRDYRNHFKPGTGFVLGNIELLKSVVKSYEGIISISDMIRGSKKGGTDSPKKIRFKILKFLLLIWKNFEEKKSKRKSVFFMKISTRKEVVPPPLPLLPLTFPEKNVYMLEQFLEISPLK